VEEIGPPALSARIRPHGRQITGLEHPAQCLLYLGSRVPDPLLPGKGMNRRRRATIGTKETIAHPGLCLVHCRFVPHKEGQLPVRVHLTIYEVDQRRRRIFFGFRTIRQGQAHPLHRERRKRARQNLAQVAQHPPAQGQVRKRAGSHSARIAPPDEQLVADQVGFGWRMAQGFS
jgi:hypothetical protein